MGVHFCLSSMFSFQSLTNNEFSDLFKTYHLTEISTDGLNKLFSDINVNINQRFTDDIDIIVQNSMNELYITTKEVNQMLKNKNYKKKFSTMCTNVQLLVNPHNFNKLECLVSELETKLDLIAINETWEKPNSSVQYKNLYGYNFLSNPG